MSPFFNPSVNGGGSSDGIGGYWSMNHGKEVIVDNNNNNVGHNANSGGSDPKNGDNTTVDFLGVGGMSLMSFSEHHQEMEI
ncbi:hypothetical protein Hanom_Chr09g00786391 [Helianthus anomalus]